MWLYSQDLSNPFNFFEYPMINFLAYKFLWLHKHSRFLHLTETGKQRETSNLNGNAWIEVMCDRIQENISDLWLRLMNDKAAYRSVDIS